MCPVSMCLQKMVSKIDSHVPPTPKLKKLNTCLPYPNQIVSHRSVKHLGGGVADEDTAVPRGVHGIIFTLGEGNQLPSFPGQWLLAVCNNFGCKML